MRLPRPCSLPPMVLLLTVAGAAACSGPQEGYYSPCNEPAGLVVGCEEPPNDGLDFTSWDACLKLARCGVILAEGQKQPGAPADQPTEFDHCVDEVQKSLSSQGQPLLTCIQEATCPDLSRTDPNSLSGSPDPNPTNDAIEGVIGYCGRLDPQ